MINYTVGSVEKLIEDHKKPASVLDYLTRVWDEATEPPAGRIPAGSVVIHRLDSTRPDYRVLILLTDVTEGSSLSRIRIVSMPHEVGFYLQDKGYAYYWDGSVWRFRKGGPRSTCQDYGFSKYIGDFEEDE